MQTRYPCGGLGRRQFLAGAAGLPALAALHVSAAQPRVARPGPRVARPEPRVARAESRVARSVQVPLGKLGIPGPFPGRVVEVRNPAMIRGGTKDRAAIKATVARGMKELTGADHPVEAWRSFFEPGDVVGIKM